MGSEASKEEHSDFPDNNEKYYGLQNHGNTCYCNSVLQCLYFCEPFRRHCLRHLKEKEKDRDRNSDKGSNMLMALAELFAQIESQKKKTGSVAPKRFIAKLREENDLFRSASHHDAHEFFNYLINDVAEYLVEQKKQSLDKTALDTSRPVTTWVHDIFQGLLENETRCLCCETITRREEPFLDLSVDIDENTSLTACVRKFSSREVLRGGEKYFCDHCGCLQEAERRLTLRRLPPLLCLHLKRFKFVEQLGRYARLPYRVVFPMELRLMCTDPLRPQRLYQLLAVVVHIGANLSHGHYVCCICSHQTWFLFDDHNVRVIEPEVLESFYGSSDESEGLRCGYLLFYKAVDEDICVDQEEGGPPGPSQRRPSQDQDNDDPPNPSKSSSSSCSSSMIALVNVAKAITPDFLNLSQSQEPSQVDEGQPAQLPSSAARGAGAGQMGNQQVNGPVAEPVADDDADDDSGESGSPVPLTPSIEEMRRSLETNNTVLSV
ncbi:unnamed protein product [Vitrella brassicaformis CCMP3155]|uniref:Ubiquitin carboxyl-terminal hydrolase n=2 Tax=Vitrella brassicaformis TaxID=1169539 RepID=A0A0G4FXR6_VITBC|nr:unnamed protein product [Vitrella brassicaformis CCMP3155]|eukprot:CEM19657.1 unnamed protein product [Vitrella brassicaformis CCMP3155]